MINAAVNGLMFVFNNLVKIGSFVFKNIAPISLMLVAAHFYTPGDDVVDLATDLVSMFVNKGELIPENLVASVGATYEQAEPYIGFVADVYSFARDWIPFLP